MERMKAIFVVTAAVAFAVSPFWTGGFAGFRPDQFPIPQNDPPIQPAGYAFAIWGLIYLALIAHGIFGLLKRDVDADWDAMRWPLIASLVVGAAWIPAAQLNPIWATVMIWIMLITAVIALVSSPERDRWLGQAPVAIYAGWLTAASFVALALVLAGYGIAPGQVAWAYIALVVALAFAIAVQSALPRAPEYGATVIWALIGIIVSNLGDGGTTGVAILAAIGIAAIAVTVFRGLGRQA